MTSLAVYIHWPFCVSKCPYCDFNSKPLPDALDEKTWVEAYQKELSFYAALLPDRKITSVYFGGGTPSLMKPESVAAILEKIKTLWPLARACEITLEANPSSSEREKFRVFRAAGVNRLSLGVQSFDDEALRFLGRAHDASAARRALEAAAETFARFSFDLIYAWRGQTLDAWREELNEALSFAPRHLSLYQLTIEPGTPFHKKTQKEPLNLEEKAAAEMFQETQAVLEKAGLPAYEISNHAAPGQESRHNLTYWTYGDYIGVGPGAQGRFFLPEGRRATENIQKPQQWLEETRRTGRGAMAEERLDGQAARIEALMMGLRLTQGIEKARWKALFGEEMESFLPREKRQPLLEEGLLEEGAAFLRATAEGRRKLNALLVYLIP